MEIPTDFFTPGSMMTLTGATSVVFVVVNGCRNAFDFNPRWLGLITSLLVSLFGVYASGSLNPTGIFVGVINGFLIFSTAAGATSMGGRMIDAQETTRSPIETRGIPSQTAQRNPLESWF